MSLWGENSLSTSLVQIKEAPLDILLNARGINGNSVLHEAVKGNNLACCEEILKRCPSLLYQRNDCGETSLYAAIRNGNLELMKFLIYGVAKTALEGEQDIESGVRELKPDKKLLKLVKSNATSALHYAVETHNIGAVRVLIEADVEKELLMMCAINKNTALHMAAYNSDYEILKLLIDADHEKKLLKIVNLDMDTALHVAVQYENIEQVNLLIASEGGEYYANKSGMTPVSLAMQMGNYVLVSRLIETRSYSSVSSPTDMYGLQVLLDIQNSEIRKLFTEKLKEQDSHENRWTSLHYAAFLGVASAAKDIIQHTPSLSRVVDNDGRNFLHISVMYERVEFVRHMLDEDIDPIILNWQDKDGNTPLHIAASSGNESLTLCFLHDNRVNKLLRNNLGQTPYLNKIKFNEQVLIDQSDSGLVVCALIATVSFAAGITIPGGYVNDGLNKGMALLLKETSFKAFVISNTFALLLSTYGIFSNLHTVRLTELADVVNQLKVAAICTYSALFVMVIAFITGSYTVLATSNGLAIFMCVITSSFFIFATPPLWKLLKQTISSWVERSGYSIMDSELRLKYVV